MTNDTATRIEHLERVNTQLMASLDAIAERPQGGGSNDKVEYLSNVVEWCQKTARVALARARDT